MKMHKIFEFIKNKQPSAILEGSRIVNINPWHKSVCEVEKLLGLQLVVRRDTFTSVSIERQV
jgi:hypothetical protein